MVMDNSTGRIRLHTKEISIITVFMGKGYMCGPMEENMKESGKTIKCRGWVHLNGAMVENMLESTMMIKNKGLENSFGVSFINKNIIIIII